MMVEHNHGISSRKRRKRPTWTSANLDLLAYVIQERATPALQASRGQHSQGRLRHTSDRDDGDSIAILARNTVYLSKLCVLTTLLEQEACIKDICERTKFRFCGSSIRLADCAIFSWGSGADENDLVKLPPLLGYLHNAMPERWQQNRGPNNARRPQVDFASQLFSIWLCQDHMRNFEDRRVVSALLAVAQQRARDGARHLLIGCLARLLVTKANDTEFIYLYAADVAPKILAMLENATAHSKGVARLTVTERKISYAPYNTFRDRLMLELQTPLPYPHTTEVLSMPR